MYTLDFRFYRRQVTQRSLCWKYCSFPVVARKTPVLFIIIFPGRRKTLDLAEEMIAREDTELVLCFCLVCTQINSSNIRQAGSWFGLLSNFRKCHHERHQSFRRYIAQKFHLKIVYALFVVSNSHHAHLCIIDYNIQFYIIIFSVRLWLARDYLNTTTTLECHRYEMMAYI